MIPLRHGEVVVLLVLRGEFGNGKKTLGPQDTLAGRLQTRLGDFYGSVPLSLAKQRAMDIYPTHFSSIPGILFCHVLCIPGLDGSRSLGPESIYT